MTSYTMHIIMNIQAKLARLCDTIIKEIVNSNASKHIAHTHTRTCTHVHYSQ